MQDGEILVCRMTNPAWVVLFTKIAGLVTDAGGVAAHPAVVSREFGIPAVVGTSNATAADQDRRPRARERLDRREIVGRSSRERRERRERRRHPRPSCASRSRSSCSSGSSPATTAPGERLVETRIAQELGTSQAPVREALRDLEQLRFVESEPFRGARVREVSRGRARGDLPGARRARGGRGPGGGRPARRRRTARSRRSSPRCAVPRTTGDLHALVEHDVRFHRLIVEASGNPTLLEVWTSLARRGPHDHHRSRRPASTTTSSPTRTSPSSRALADARSRAGRRARCAAHIEEFGELVLRGGTA